MISRTVAISVGRKLGAFLALMTLGIGGSGCLAETPVTRVMDGRTVEGPLTPPSAYSAFLEGVLLEEGGKPREAAVAFRISLASFDEDPNVWSHLARAVCASGASDGAREIRRARSLDSEFAGASLAEAACARKRGERAREEAGISRARSESPYAVLPLRAHSAEREKEVIAATLLRSEQAGAWKALVEWAIVHRKEAIEFFAWGRWLARDAGAHSEAGKRMGVLVAQGASATARRLAGLVVDTASGVGGRFDAMTAGLAVDAAVETGDFERVRSVAVRAHLPLDEAALRAYVLGEAAVGDLLVAERISVGDRSPLMAWLPALYSKQAPRGELPAFSSTDWPLLTAALGTRIQQLSSPSVASEWRKQFAQPAR